MPRLTHHLAGLDGVRGLAVLLVMAVHFVGSASGQTFWQKALIKASTYGWVGVDLFFVLSGFLITGLLIESKGGPHYFRNFYARRTLRIFPLYYFVLACLFLILPLITTTSPLLAAARTHQVWLWTYTSNFYIASASSWESLNYVSHFWSLAIEEQFYLLWPLIVLCFSRYALERICVCVVLFALGLRIALAFAGVSEISISVLTPCRADTLCVGAFLALRIRRPGALPIWVGWSGRAVLVLALALVVLMTFGRVIQLGVPALHQVRNSLFALLFGALLLVALKPRSDPIARVLQGSVLRFFGKYSYGLYVYHGIVSWYLYEVHAEARLDSLLGNHAWAIATRAVIGIAVSLLMAMGSFHLLEKRFLALKRYFEARSSRYVAVDDRSDTPAPESAAIGKAVAPL